jgi:predicted DNA-binding transcriptional regulator AlpA
MEYMFTLSYQLSDDDCNHDEIVERLGAAGCDDALVGIGQAGRIALEFTREADDAAAALLSALTDVRRAVPTAKLIESAPDFVGLTDVAELFGMSRQNMLKLMEDNPTSFPIPVHEGVASIWHLADVLAWLQTKGNYKIDQAIMEVSKATRQINSAKAAQDVTLEMQRKVDSLVA